MPLPKRKKRETKNQFIPRCMKDSVMKREFPKQKQRLAVCFTLFNKSLKKKK